MNFILDMTCEMIVVLLTQKCLSNVHAVKREGCARASFVSQETGRLKTLPDCIRALLLRSTVVIARGFKFDAA